eukprot:2100054-Alexandrium_andersonii.AAC.1
MRTRRPRDSSCLPPSVFCKGATSPIHAGFARRNARASALFGPKTGPSLVKLARNKHDLLRKAKVDERGLRPNFCALAGSAPVRARRTGARQAPHHAHQLTQPQSDLRARPSARVLRRGSQRRTARAARG